MQSYLETFDLWEIIDEDRPLPPVPTNPTVVQIRNCNEEKAKWPKTKTVIQNSVSNSIFFLIMVCKTAKEAWDKLKMEYRGSDWTRQMQVLNMKRDFEVLSMKEDESISKFSDWISLIVNQFGCWCGFS